MICIVSRHQRFRLGLQTKLQDRNVEAKVFEPSMPDNLAELYNDNLNAIVIDYDIAGLPKEAWHSLLRDLASRLTVVIVNPKSTSLAAEQAGLANINPFDRPIKKPSMRSFGSLGDCLSTTPESSQALEILHDAGVLIERATPTFDTDPRSRGTELPNIPYWQNELPKMMLSRDGALNILLIDTSAIRRTALDYGTETYEHMQQWVQDTLAKLWGSSGSFRSSDLLRRRAANSDIYYLLLAPSRTGNPVTAPGVLEGLAERLTNVLQNKLWHDITMGAKKGIAPGCVRTIPHIGVGFATCLNNPCVTPDNLLEPLLEKAFEEAQVQAGRRRDRRREEMHTLIMIPNLLEPHFQGVFRLNQISKEQVQAASRQGLGALSSAIYGFESLIRVQKEAVAQYFDAAKANGPDLSLLRPDVLFDMARALKLGLELDQACLNKAINRGRDLPGFLMVNILPRNLYNVAYLESLADGSDKVIFEVSENEAISNFDQILRVRAALEKAGMGVATDDFGKGHSGLEQIVRLRPDLIKLDRSLVCNIHLDSAKSLFVQGLVDAVSVNGATILAEGIEVWEEAACLQKMGIELVQGFLFHKPSPKESIQKELEMTTPTITPLKIAN